MTWTDGAPGGSIAPAELDKVQADDDHDEGENRQDGGHQRTPCSTGV
jgi:hypothetical protein